MRKLSTILMAVALVLGMAQCKKEQPKNQGKTVTITLDVNGGSNSGATRVDVDPYNSPMITFEEGDEILVGYNGAYVGSLFRNGTSFTGDITLVESGSQPLYFYFLGNNAVLDAPVNDDIIGCTVDISDQTGKLPLISMAPSNEPYTDGTTAYSAKLRNKCALVMFEVDCDDWIHDLHNELSAQDQAAWDITHIHVAYDKVIVDFSNNELTYGTIDGQLEVAGGPGTRWAIVLPQGPQTEKVATCSDVNFVGWQEEMDFEIKANDFIDTPVVLWFEEGMDLRFSVSPSKKIYFAPGNLQYQASTQTYRFAEHQYDWVGIYDTNQPDGGTAGNVYENSVKCGNNLISDSYSGWIDLFGWGTGTNPTNVSENAADYSEFNEWGLHVGDGQWYTLSKDEWDYVLHTRDNASHLIGWYSIPEAGSNAFGIIILPDKFFDYHHGFNYNSDAQHTNEYTLEEWAVMEEMGAIILPGVGTRMGTYVDLAVNPVYWTSTSSDGEFGSEAYLFSPHNYNGGGGEFYEGDRTRGWYVKLARDVSDPQP